MDGRAEIAEIKKEMSGMLIGESVEKLKREAQDKHFMTVKELDESGMKDLRKPSQDSEIDPAAWIGLRKSGSQSACITMHDNKCQPPMQ